MSKKKTRKRVVKTIVPKVETVFDCPFCNHKKSVEVKFIKSKNEAVISCRVCGTEYIMATNSLTAPIDVYYEWIDKSEEVNR